MKIVILLSIRLKKRLIRNYYPSIYKIFVNYTNRRDQQNLEVNFQVNKEKSSVDVNESKITEK
jgi:hypothetical protein